MFIKILQHTIFQYAMTLVMLLGVGLCMFPEYFPFLKWGSNYSVLAMLLFLLVGILFLTLKQYKLVFVSLGCCAALCIFLKHSTVPRDAQDLPFLSTKTQRARIQTLPPVDIKVAHFTMTDVAENIDSALTLMKNIEADLLSLQEIDPYWAILLEDSLKVSYPYFHTLIDLGIFGKAIFSKHPLINVDTVYYEEIPNLVGSILIEDKNIEVSFVSLHTYPDFSASYYERLKGHLDTVATFITTLDAPVLAIGDLNAVSWRNEIQVFLENSKLFNSRAGFLSMDARGNINLLDLPVDHIFYSKHFKCLNFETLTGGTSTHLGIRGTYRLKPYLDVEKSLQ